jgi:hypothetical protein
MSKTDWVTIAATLVGVGLGYYVKGPKAAAVCLAVGAIIFFIVHRRKKPDKQAAEKIGTSEINESFNPKFVQTANPTTIVNVNPPVAPVVVHRPAPLERSKPNVVFLGARTTDIDVAGTYQSRVFHEVPDSQLVGIVACFRNVAIYGKTIKHVFNAKAHLRFMGSNGEEWGTGISRACWLDHAGDMIDLAPGDSGCVIVLVSREDDFSVPWIRRTRTQWGDTLSDERLDFDSLPPTIEVSLLDDNSQLLLPPIVLEITAPNGLPQATVKSVT